MCCCVVKCELGGLLCVLKNMWKSWGQNHVKNNPNSNFGVLWPKFSCLLKRLLIIDPASSGFPATVPRGYPNQAAPHNNVPLWRIPWVGNISPGIARCMRLPRWGLLNFFSKMSYHGSWRIYNYLLMSHIWSLHHVTVFVKFDKTHPDLCFSAGRIRH